LFKMFIVECDIVKVTQSLFGHFDETERKMNIELQFYNICLSKRSY
jgi:hypothetical protein